MQQVAPGRYVARVKTADEGAYHFDLSQWVGGQAAFRQTRGMIVGYPEELRLRTTNEELLRRIADVTGGQYNVKPQDLFADAEKTAHRAQPLWPFLVTAALVLFVLDVALRRVDFSLLI